MRQHSIVLLPGDGIGPEITAVARSLLKAVAAKYKFGLHFNEQAIGGAAISICGDPLPNTTLQACQSVIRCLHGIQNDAFQLLVVPGVVALHSGLHV